MFPFGQVAVRPREMSQGESFTLVESSSEPRLENSQRSCEKQNGWRVCSFHSDFPFLAWDNTSPPNVELNVKSCTTLVGTSRGSFLCGFRSKHFLLSILGHNDTGRWVGGLGRFWRAVLQFVVAAGPRV